MSLIHLLLFGGPKCRRRVALWGTAPAIFVMAAGCGGHSVSARSASSATSSRTQTLAATPPPTREARRVRSICRHNETTEDRNVVLQFANQGMRIFSPNVASALRTASGDISAEGQAVRTTTADHASSTSALVQDIGDEAQILRRTAHLVQLRTDEAALVSVLHRRISAAHKAGVPTCAGAPANALVAKSPTACGTPVGRDQSIGSRARRTVPAPGWLSMASVPLTAAMRSRSP